MNNQFNKTKVLHTCLPSNVSTALSPPIASPLSSHIIVILVMLLGREDTIVAVDV